MAMIKRLAFAQLVQAGVPQSEWIAAVTIESLFGLVQIGPTLA